MRKFLMGIALLVVLVGAGISVLYWRASQGIAPEILEQRYMILADRFVDIDGARVRIREEGPESAPPIILLHGYTHSLETWNQLTNRLKGDFRVIRYDLLGHGLTGPDPKRRYSVHERAAFAENLMIALGIERATIIGNSLGGLVAWRFAADHPERVNALIDIAGPAFPYSALDETQGEVPLTFKLYLKTAPKSGVRKAAELIWAEDSKITEARLSLMRDMMRRRGNGEAFIQHAKAFTLPDPTTALADITAPALLIWGAEDLIVPVDQGERMEDVIPNARLTVFHKVGHTPQEESPAKTAAAIIDFLAEISPKTLIEDEGARTGD